jgi:LemA protein
MSTGWIVLGVIVILVLFAFAAYNRLVTLSQRVNQAFAVSTCSSSSATI